MKVLFWFGLVFTIVAPVVLGTLGYVPVAWLTLLSGAFVTLMSRLPDITEIALGPVRARMREVISDANATLKQLRSVALASAEAITTSLISESFLGQHPFLERLKLKDDVVQGLRMIGISNEEQRAVLKRWNLGIANIYYRKIRRSFDNEPPEVCGPIREELKKLVDFSEWYVSPPSEFRALLERHNALNEDRTEWIDDYEHFLKTGEIRRLDLWKEE